MKFYKIIYFSFKEKKGYELCNLLNLQVFLWPRGGHGYLGQPMRKVRNKITFSKSI